MYISAKKRQNNTKEDSTMNKLTSGAIAPKTGEYSIVTANGRRVGTVRVKKGNRMPPTQHAGSHFEID